VDAVSGATISADAVKRTIEVAARRFAREVLGRDVAAIGAPPAAPLDPGVVVLAALLLGAVVLRAFPDPWLRRGWLVLVLVLAGLWRNLSYASPAVLSFVTGEWPAAALTAAFALVVVVPVAVLLLGNVWCGWMCPFGALQELAGEVGRRRWQSDPHRAVWRLGRAVKYALLALLLVAAVLSGRREVLEADPLVTVFGRGAAGGWTGGWTLLVVPVVLLSLPFGRFFCRNLCPAGAFLALLNRARLLRRFLPAPRPGRCDLGVRSHHELDCLCCDRCRHAEPAQG
jgi:polyferredoxin